MKRQKRQSPSMSWPDEDRRAWHLACEPFDDESVASTRAASLWRTRTQLNAENYYNQWLNWLVQNDPELLALPLSERVTRKTVKAYAKAERERGLKPRSLASSIANLGMAMKVVAPLDDWRWLFKAANIYASSAAEPDFVSSLPSSAELYGIGESLMAQAEDFASSCNRVGDEALRFRDGLMISLLAVAPVRRENLAAFQIGSTVLRLGTQWKIVLPTELTKTGRPYECAWPQSLMADLETYLGQHRLTLLGGRPDHGALWVSYRGGPISAGAISPIISSRTKVAIGLSVSPHPFRHAAATTMAEENPEAVSQIAGLLGHGSAKTSEKFYIKAKAKRAFERHAQIVRPTGQTKRIQSPRQLPLIV